MVKVKRSFPAPESLAEEEKKAAGRYDKPDVIERLKEDFHNKCYICEMKELQDPNVEHLLPHKNGKYPERKYDWEKYKQLEKVHKNPESKTSMRMTYSLLRRESAFAAFKRCYVREHVAEYPQLQEFVALDT